MELDRPDPDDLLRKVNEDEKRTDGRLKIFFGYAAGVGKTYAMLEAAHHAQKEGVDVVAGYIEPHTRPETLSLLEGLEQLHPLLVRHRNITLREFDLDGALSRHPQLILVDELAHTNAESCRHRKRYQDIEELLHAGIDVYTTVNVQHLESLNDVIASVTGVAVSERIPDRVFDSALQVEVVDIEPDDLIARLEHGKVYDKSQAQKALSSFFIRKNLVALREIALRRTADRLNRSVDQNGVDSMLNAGEHILTCVSGAPSNAKVIRTAARMSEAFHSEFTALYVEQAKTDEQKGDDGRRLRANMELAEVLGAHIVTVYGDDVAVQIAEYAKAGGVTKIVIGRPNGRRSRFSSKKNLVDKLTEQAPDIDIYIIPDTQPAYRGRKGFGWLHGDGLLRFSWKDLGKSLLMVMLASLVAYVFYILGLGEANIITVYILGVLFASILAEGWIYGSVASLASVLLFNFFFTEPRFTLHAYDASYPVTFLVMLAASVITSSLTLRIKTQARQAARKSYRTELLLETSRKLQQVETVGDILAVTALQICKLLERPVLFYAVDEHGTVLPPLVFSPRNEDVPSEYSDEDEQAVAQWVARNGKPAGVGTDTLPSAKCLYLSARGQGRILAVAGIVSDGAAAPDAFEKNLLTAMLDECGTNLEKSLLHAEKRDVELHAQQETLRANLLRAISHDLRTPLTSISGNAGILMENSLVLDELKRRQLYADIYDDSLWLVNLVENLLAVTRIENGTFDLRTEPELLDDVFREALSHLDRKASEHGISMSLSDDLLMAKMDARLVVQVIINLVNNAIQYTPRGSRIELSARRLGTMVEVTVSDDGPGLSDEAKRHVFEMFYTADNSRGDGRRGLGLGLSLCKSIVLAHGGTIVVKDNRPKGTIFRFTLHVAEVNCDE